jgi:5-methylcytosine-specific restriction endonuclease McrA
MCKRQTVYSTTEERTLRNRSVWHRKSEEVRDKAHFLCEVCKDQGILNHRNLEVHHIVKLRDDETLMLDNYNLICLCSEHHHLADSGGIDVEYLKRLARKRED